MTKSLYDEMKSTLFNVALTGELVQDVQKICDLNQVSHAYLWNHLSSVAEAARDLAQNYQVDPEIAYTAGLLHDIGGLVPDAQKVALAESLGMICLPEEKQVPMLLHSKLSVYFAADLFGKTSPACLNAILYHTTLHANATDLEKVVFLADKIKWDGDGRPPYLTGLLSALDQSLDTGTKFFIDVLYHSDLKVLHPWLSEAYTAYSKINENIGF